MTKNTAKPKNKIQISQQKLLRLEVRKLKSLQNMEIDFSSSPLTAIMGGNCCGKTTILHALACSFGPLNKDKTGYKFPQFFKPNTDSLWKGSDFSVHYEQRIGKEQQKSEIDFTKIQDRWSPRYERRPLRYVDFLMIRDSVPEVETFGLNTMVHYTKKSLITPADDEIRTAAGIILNKSYENYHEVTYQHGKKLSIGVSSGTITYPALSMSSGEQRVFHILKTIFSAPKYSLLLIDEIDLFLHQDALSRLLAIVRDHCAKNNKQLVFTTHFPPVANMYADIAVKMLQATPAKTIVWNGYSPAALGDITGIEEKPISVYVEDDVAEAIVARVATDLRIRPYLRIRRYGAAINAFGLGVGMFLSGKSLSNNLILQDGDIFETKIGRRECTQKLLTGTEKDRDKDRKVVCSIIRPLSANMTEKSQKKSPEQMLHHFLHSLIPTGLDNESVDLLSLAQKVISVPERHGLVDKIVILSGEDRSVALSKLVKLASQANGWNRYTRIIRFWLNDRCAANNLLNI